MDFSVGNCLEDDINMLKIKNASRYFFYLVPKGSLVPL